MMNLSTSTDYELVELYENGNDKAFDEILQRHQNYVYSYILFLVKEEDVADDIFQETFTRAIIAIRSHRYQTTGKFSAWLIRIAHNLIVDSTRETETGKIIFQEKFSSNILNDIRLSEGAIEGNIMEEQKADQIRKMLDYLPEVQREVIIMRFYEDLSFKEIAEKTGVSINTSLGRMRYALINLRKLIQQHNVALVG
ncbi:MAG: sigma-70 family RNA polymerase sigma factor [Bacteroidaceae bacterium]|nr:sigma-70 family RNA polymerase sigma factor [Bacteroidaceae bacterium]MBR1902738.1 sigma-70 family RNA polymerase sigma factor [Bacteroidaceae bacterium]